MDRAANPKGSEVDDTIESIPLLVRGLSLIVKAKSEGVGLNASLYTNSTFNGQLIVI